MNCVVPRCPVPAVVTFLVDRDGFYLARAVSQGDEVLACAWHAVEIYRAQRPRYRVVPPTWPGMAYRRIG